MTDTRIEEALTKIRLGLKKTEQSVEQVDGEADALALQLSAALAKLAGLGNNELALGEADIVSDFSGGTAPTEGVASASAVWSLNKNLTDLLSSLAAYDGDADVNDYITNLNTVLTWVKDQIDNGSISLATASANGLMSASDFSKLQSIAPGATAVNVLDWISSTSTTDPVASRHIYAIAQNVNSSRKFDDSVYLGTDKYVGGAPVPELDVKLLSSMLSVGSAFKCMFYNHRTDRLGVLNTSADTIGYRKPEAPTTILSTVGVTSGYRPTLNKMMAAQPDLADKGLMNFATVSSSNGNNPGGWQVWVWRLSLPYDSNDLSLSNQVPSSIHTYQDLEHEPVSLCFFPDGSLVYADATGDIYQCNAVIDKKISNNSLVKPQKVMGAYRYQNLNLFSDYVGRTVLSDESGNLILVDNSLSDRVVLTRFRGITDKVVDTFTTTEFTEITDMVFVGTECHVMGKIAGSSSLHFCRIQLNKTSGGGGGYDHAMVEPGNLNKVVASGELGAAVPNYHEPTLAAGQTFTVTIPPESSVAELATSKELWLTHSTDGGSVKFGAGTGVTIVNDITMSSKGVLIARRIAENKWMISMEGEVGLSKTKPIKVWEGTNSNLLLSSMTKSNPGKYLVAIGTVAIEITLTDPSAHSALPVGTNAVYSAMKDDKLYSIEYDRATASLRGKMRDLTLTNPSADEVILSVYSLDT